MKPSRNSTMTPAPIFSSRDTIAKPPMLNHTFCCEFRLLFRLKFLTNRMRAGPRSLLRLARSLFPRIPAKIQEIVYLIYTRTGKPSERLGAMHAERFIVHEMVLRIFPEYVIERHDLLRLENDSSLCNHALDYTSRNCCCVGDTTFGCSCCNLLAGHGM